MALAALLLIQPSSHVNGSSQVDSTERLLVVDTNPAAVNLLATTTFARVGQIPLDRDPTAVALGSGDRFLYVLHNGLMRPNGKVDTGEATVTIVDLAAARVLKTIPLGWNVLPPVLSQDGRRVLFLSVGRWDHARARAAVGSVTIIDTLTNEVAVLRIAQLGHQVAWTADFSRVFVAGSVARWPLVGGKFPKGAPSIVASFTLPAGELVGEVKVPGYVGALAVSKDERWLYVLEEGAQPGHKGRVLTWPKQLRNAMVHVVDVTTGRVVKSHTLGVAAVWLVADPTRDVVTAATWTSRQDSRGRLFVLRGTELLWSADIGREPQALVRLADTARTYAVSYEDMREFTGAELSPARLVLNRPRGAAATPEAPRVIEGYPGQLLALPGGDRVVMMIVNKAGGPTNHVAILDLSRGRVERVIETGRSSVRVAKFIGEVALYGALCCGLIYAAYAAAHGPGIRLEQVTATADGRFVYALNSRSNDVTIIDANTGGVIDMIAVGSARAIGVVPNGRHLVAIARDQLTLLDTTTNKVSAQHDLAPDHLNGLYFDQRGRRMFAPTTTRLVVFDADRGQIVTTLSGFKDPYWVIPLLPGDANNERP